MYGTGKKKIILNSFFNAHFNYCSLILMFHSYTSNNKAKHLQERCLRLMYSNKNSSHETLTGKDMDKGKGGSVTINHENI